MKYFFDVGANVGQTFPEFLLKHPTWRAYHIVCIEPSPRHLPALMETAKRYRNAFQGITIVPVAVWGEEPRLVPFYQKTQPLADSLDREFRTNIDAGYDLLVPARRLDYVISMIAKDRDDTAVVKLDIEGAEYGVLQDMKSTITSAKVRRMFVEWHDPSRKQEEIELREHFATRGVPLEEWLL